VAWFLILNCHVIDRLNPGDEIIASGKDKTGVNVGPDPAAFQIRVHPRKWPGHGQLLLPPSYPMRVVDASHLLLDR
jgi:hypothetical protein